MNDTRWCGNAEVLMSYLYEDGDSAERRAFEAHLQACPACAAEVRDLGALRTGLAQWTPPDTVLDFRIVRDEPGRSWRSRLAFPVMPAWAQLGAAALLVGVAVGISGLEIRYDDRGVTLRTGWQQAVEPAAAPVQAAAPAASGTEAWKTDLAALEQRLRREWQAAPAAAADVRPASGARPAGDDENLAHVQALIAASEARQNREMALRVAQVLRDVDTQRRTDLAHLTNGMGVIEGRAVSAVAQQRQMIDYLMRVSSQRDPRQ